MVLKYTYGSRSGSFALRRHLDVSNVALNDTVQSLKGSLMRSERELRKSLGGLAEEHGEKENDEDARSQNGVRKEDTPNRRALGDVTNKQSRTVQVTRKDSGKKKGQKSDEVDLPSIQSSPLKIVNGRVLIERTPPASKSCKVDSARWQKVGEEDKGKKTGAKSRPKKIALKKKKGKERPQGRLLKIGSPLKEATSKQLKVQPEMHFIQFTIRPEDIGSTIWVRRAA